MKDPVALIGEIEWLIRELKKSVAELQAVRPAVAAPLAGMRSPASRPLPEGYVDPKLGTLS